MCVPVVAQLAQLEGDLEPLGQRAERIRTLHQAITLEDSTRVSPFADGDPLESAVQQWFIADGELAREWVETEDEAIIERRREGREAIRERLQEALEEVSQEVDQRLEQEGDLGERAPHCEDMVFVRSAVLEACETADSPLCEGARSQEPGGSFRFVDDPENLWDMDQLRPWSEPGRIGPTPEGGLGGSRTATLARRGNMSLVVSLGPLLRQRSVMTEEEIQEFEVNLETLGFDFQHPDFVMAPAITLHLDTPGRLADESEYILHFGDLSNPEEQVIFSLPAEEEGPIQATFPAPEWVLALLGQGEPMALTAVRFFEPDEELYEGEALYSLDITPVRQTETVGELLAYWAEGHFSEDLAALIPPAEDEIPR